MDIYIFPGPSSCSWITLIRTVHCVLQVIFRYTLALFKYKEEDFLKIHDSVEIYHYLRFFTKTISDSR